MSTPASIIKRLAAAAALCVGVCVRGETVTAEPDAMRGRNALRFHD